MVGVELDAGKWPRLDSPVEASTRPLRQLALPLLAGALIAETLGVVAREKTISPDAYPAGFFRLFFSDTLHLKAWLATVAVLLACTQLFTAAWIFRKLPWSRPPFVNVVHRWAGRLAFLATLPVAYHCIFLLGFQTYTTRVAVHSFFGAAVYGAFAAKVTIVRMHRFPRWVLPVAGSLLFVTLLGVWYTSALWFFRTFGEGI